MHKENTVSTGQNAESFVADFLINQGYKILDRNWRNKWCEIDIVAQKNNIIYFVEVRYRKSSTWGSGVETITPKKYQQMNFAAEFWINSHSLDRNAHLVVASVSGQIYTLDDFIVL